MGRMGRMNLGWGMGCRRGLGVMEWVIVKMINGRGDVVRGGGVCGGVLGMDIEWRGGGMMILKGMRYFWGGWEGGCIGGGKEGGLLIGELKKEDWGYKKRGGGGGGIMMGGYVGVGSGVLFCEKVGVFCGGGGGDVGRVW